MEIKFLLEEAPYCKWQKKSFKAKSSNLTFPKNVISKEANFSEKQKGTILQMVLV